MLLKFFKLFFFIFLAAIIVSCGGGSSKISTNSFLLPMGKSGSFVTQDGVKVTIVTPTDTRQNGTVEVSELKASIKENPVIEKVSNGLIINVTGTKIKKSETEYLSEPIEIILEYPANLKNKIKEKTVRLYRINEKDKTLEIYPAVFKNDKVYFKVYDIGTSKFIILNNKLIPKVYKKDNATLKGELPSTPEVVDEGPINFFYPITDKNDYIILEENLAKIGKVYNNTKRIKLTIDGQTINVNNYEANLYTDVYGNSKLQININRPLPAGNHLLKQYLYIPNFCVEGECLNYSIETFSTYFIVQPFKRFSHSSQEIEILLKKYAPVVEFGDLTYFSGKVEDGMARTLKEVYGNYTDEHYYPIDLRDLEVCTKEEEEYNYTDVKDYLPFWLKNLNEENIPKKLIFVVCNNGNCYKTILNSLVYFYSSSGGLGLNNGYEYTIAYKSATGKYYRNGAQFVTRYFLEKKGIESKIFATYNEDEKYIYICNIGFIILMTLKHLISLPPKL